MSVCWNTLENVVYESVLISLEESNMFGSSYLLWGTEGKWLNSCYFVGLQSYNFTDKATARKNSHFISSQRSYFHMVDNLSIAVHAFPMCRSISLSIAELLLPKYMNWFTDFTGLTSNEKLAPFGLKHMTVYLPLRRDHCFLLLAPGYAAEFGLSRCICKKQ